jgi:hypothetical protein
MLAVRQAGLPGEREKENGSGKEVGRELLSVMRERRKKTKTTGEGADKKSLRKKTEILQS